MTHSKEITKNETVIKEKPQHFGWILVIYLLGLFMGAIDTGIVTPARTIIQGSLGVDEQYGIWMITIYTLCYAAIIPISGKLADRHGRKIVFMLSIFLFGLGSLVDGLSSNVGSFEMLLVGRVIQAVGAGGIMPVATAEFGTSFPEEKRGMALGLVGGIFGMGNVLGTTAGSAILDICGAENWEWIFYINVPICAFILITSIFFIPNHKSEVTTKIDKLGTVVMTVIILSLLYGLKNLDFFDFLNSLTDIDVWPFLLLAAALIPGFVFIEKRADDAVFHIEYMSNRQIVLVLGMGLLIGMSMMGMIFIPQFAENALKIPVGDGGYFVIILGLFAGATSPVSGKMIDKMGVKPVLAAGFGISIVGAAYLAFIATNYLNAVNVIISLVLIGLGMGLTMGTPMNYMMLKNTSDEESNSALATLSLVRSIGTAIAPAIMVGFLAQAGAGMQTDLMNVFPEIPDMPKMEQQAELTSIVDELKKSDEFKEQMGDIDLDSMLNQDMNMDMDMTSTDEDIELPDELLKELQEADVTTITKSAKHMASYMFSQFTPDVIKDIQTGIQEGIDGIDEGIEGVDSGIGEMKSGLKELKTGKDKLSQGIAGVTKGIEGMQSGIDKMDSNLKDMDSQLSDMEAKKAKLQKASAGAQKGVDAIRQQISQTESTISGLNEKKAALEQEMKEHPEKTEEIMAKLGPINGQLQGLNAALSGMEDGLKEAQGKLDELNTAIAGIEKGIDGVKAGKQGVKKGRSKLKAKQSNTISKRSSMESAYSQMGTAESEMSKALGEVQSQAKLMARARELMVSMKEDIPNVFKDVEEQYLAEIDKNSDKIEGVYQSTLNGGFKSMFICVMIFNLLGLVLMMFYRDEKKKA